MRNEHRKTAFIGHRKIFCKDIDSRLKESISSEIQLGCHHFTMGTHGDFDTLSLFHCKQFRQTDVPIDIEVVITSLNKIKKEVDVDEFGIHTYTPYQDVKTIMYDIENEYFKKQIIISNRKMIDECDTLICYVDPKRYRSGAKIAMNYAKRKGLKIINLYREEDNIIDNSTKK